MNSREREVSKIYHAEFSGEFHPFLTSAGLKTGVENGMVWSEKSQDLENRAVHPYREFREVLPPSHRRRPKRRHWKVHLIGNTLEFAHSDF